MAVPLLVNPHWRNSRGHPTGAGPRRLKNPIRFTVGRKLPCLAHASSAHLCVSCAKLFDEGAIHLEMDMVMLTLLGLIPTAHPG